MKIMAAPAGPVTARTQGWGFVRSFQCSGNGKAALWLPGTQAKPPSSGLMSLKVVRR